MPLHDVGYRPWRGTLGPPGRAAGVIAATGLRLAWQGRWLRRAVILGWSPAIVFALSFFAFEQLAEDGGVSQVRSAWRAGDGWGILGTVLGDALGAGPAAFAPESLPATRRLVWSRLLLAFMRVPQALLMAVVIGIVAPPLISRDTRAKAWLVYFTRPLARWEYVLGKAATLAALVALITTLPALVLWGVGVLVSPSLAVAVATWDLPLRVVGATAAVAVPTVLLALAFSALTAESRIATFAWFATWVACWIAHATLTGADALAEAGAAPAAARPAAVGGGPEDPFDDADVPVSRRVSRPSGPPPVRWLARAAGIDDAPDRWAWLSLYHAIGVVQAWIFGIERRAAVVAPPLVSLAVVAAGSLLVLAWRVGAPARA